MSFDPMSNPRANGSKTHVPQYSMDSELHPPQAGFRNSVYTSGAPSNASFDSKVALQEGGEKYGGTSYPPLSGAQARGQGAGKKRRWGLIGGILGGVLLVVIVAVVAVYFGVVKKNSNNDSKNTGDGANNGNTDKGAQGPITGADGTTITTETGATFIYKNSFGGFWVSDPDDPYNNNAQAQSWSPPLNQTWKWGVDIVRGVNLGGWLVPEPFIVPGLFAPYLNANPPASDEWTLSLAMRADTAKGGINQMEDHYKTFITEEDFAKIAGAGLNWIRLPIPFWAIQTYDGEPFLEGVAWKYILKAFQWARKYGLRINLDLHTFPGSQNGYNHSGKQGQINFLHGVMGMANAERGLDYIRMLTEYISQEQFKNLVPLFGVINEARTRDIGVPTARSFYLHMHDYLRNITGIGEGNGPYLSIHDGFQPLATWADFIPGRDRVAMDAHPYLCFANVDARPLIDQITPGPPKPCRSWARNFNASWTNFGVTTAGEWSLAINDCGKWINGIEKGTRWEGTLESYNGPDSGSTCEFWDNWQAWDDDTKANLKTFALATMDALQHYFFWTWKIGPALDTGVVEAPFWSYSLGLEHGWMPLDPREATGICGTDSPAQMPPRPIMTGGAGSGTIAAAERAKYPWPPATLSPGGWAATELPQYTPTGTIPTLAQPTFTDSKGKVIDVVVQKAQSPIFTPASGCTYPDAWDALTVPVPAAGVCGGRARKRSVAGDAELPKRTAPPA